MRPSLQERLALATVNSKCSLYLSHVGKESALPMAVLTQELLLHAERCMRHEDVVVKMLLAELNSTLDEWLCDSFVELIKEMKLWKWDDATRDFLSRLAKALQQSNI